MREATLGKYEPLCWQPIPGFSLEAERVTSLRWRCLVSAIDQPIEAVGSETVGGGGGAGRPAQAHCGEKIISRK